jgi:cyclophilin family peptidyl-prolyl cis-trans isomerase
METSAGTITIELFENEAPETVANFLQYVDDGFYSDTIFHRVISNFVIQGGGLTADMSEKPNREPVKNEADNGLKNERGALSMARTAVVDSATSQFFINVADNAFLDHKSKTPDGYGYAVFGKIVEGMDVVDAIKDVPTGNYGPFSDVPKEPVVITGASRA